MSKPSRPSLFRILGEDKRHVAFVESTLKTLGFGRHAIRPLSVPAGRGDAKQWVRNQLPEQVKAMRQRNASARGYLIVITDADNGTVETRVRSLNAALTNGEQDHVSNDGPVEYWIPKWSIESWLLCLLASNCSEEVSLKHEFQNRYGSEEKRNCESSNRHFSGWNE